MPAKRFTTGPRFLVDFGNRILDEVDGVTVMPTPQMPQAKTKTGIILMPVAASSSSVVKAALQPGSDVSTNAVPQYTITSGFVAGGIPTISGTALVPVTASNIITLGTSDQVVYVQLDFTYTANGAITIVDNEIKSSTNAAFAMLASSLTPGTPSTGTLYWPLFSVAITAPVGSGPYTVAAAPGVNGSININICSGQGLVPDSIQGPFDA